MRTPCINTIETEKYLALEEAYEDEEQRKLEKLGELVYDENNNVQELLRDYAITALYSDDEDAHGVLIEAFMAYYKEWHGTTRCDEVVTESQLLDKLWDEL